MSGYITAKASNCKNCYKCIRHCPMKAIGFAQNQARILEEECVLCGKCLVNCPQNVKGVRDDLPSAKKMVGAGAEVYVSLAPSFVAAFSGTSFASMREALRSLGFTDAEETALGAAAVKTRYEQIIREGKQKVILSSCCHSVNTLVQKYYPDAVSHLAKVITPMTAHGLMLKRAHPDCKVVFIGPCISKKAEAEEYPGAVDCVLTFDDLALWMEQARVVPNQDAHVSESAGRTRLFPTAGGIIDSMDTTERNGYSFIAVDGIENCISVLEDVTAGGLGRCFIEMSACAGSCVGGPIMGKTKPHPIRDRLAVRNSAGDDDFQIEQPDAKLLERNIPVVFIGRVKPGTKTIEDVLRKMGKTLPEHELNCGSCGYETCRDKAAAVLGGKAEIAMCLPYLMGRAESFSDHIISNTPNGIIVLNRAMEIQQINAAARHMMNISEEASVLGRNIVCILDPVPFSQVISDKQNIYDVHVFLAEYRKHVGMTILFDENYDIVIALMRDVTEEYTERAGKDELGRKAIEIADKVIDKQMRTVQEIASLLGETTAETKVALERLKETFVE